uniref:DUF721 domain-containing protein n=1 Tax=uncultured Muribaculaceae bacterium TaxID=2301481 RepID=A0A6G8F3P1_9BACT|nr:hypothetical protein Muribac1_0620 [uncultured Muribaculaceae bacterium]
MERKDSQSIGDVLRLAFQENCMQGRLDECRAVDIWPEIVGPAIAVQCRRPFVAKGIMTVGVPNASLRNELSMNRSLLIRAINRHLGKETVTQIRFVSG